MTAILDRDSAAWPRCPYCDHYISLHTVGGWADPLVDLSNVDWWECHECDATHDGPPPRPPDDNAPASVGAPTGAHEQPQPLTEATVAPLIFIAGQPDGKPAVVILGGWIERDRRVDLLLDNTTLSSAAAVAVLALADEFPDFVAWMPIGHSAG